jgi:phosphoribosylamine--glycine ligase
MKILIIGSGCREHALAWKFSLSEKTEKIFIAPGNAGTVYEKKCENVLLKAVDTALPECHNELLEFALREKITMTVVGPEMPLAQGIADKFRAAGLDIIGPDKRSAQLEASKIYSKEFMTQYSVRTAKSKKFTDADAAIHYARNHFKSAAPPLVIKADGLAAGKGVVVAQNYGEAEAALLSFMKSESLGKAGTSVLLEEFLEGKEVSVLAAVSVREGKGNILPFIPARDHKRRFEGGQGPNTGGMGAIAPVPDFTVQAQNDFMAAILQPTLNGLLAENLDYRGFLFFGLMVHKSRCSLLEYNVRLGDPETEAVLPLMDSDIADLCCAVHDGTLENFSLKWKNGAVCAPIAVAEGYPASYRKGEPLTVDQAALEKANAKIFYGGVTGSGTIDNSVSGKPAAALYTGGGRVLAVSAYGSHADEAWENAYQGLNAVSFTGMSFRRDIGREAAVSAND